MKFNRILFFTLTMLSTTAFSAERPPQPNKKGALDVLPAELRFEQVQAIASPPLTLKQAIANIKTYYIAHPPSRNSVGTTKAILTHLMKEYYLDASELQRVVDTLAKRETMTVFNNPEMIAWIHEQKERLDKEDELGRAAQKRDVKRVKDLLAQGVNVNAKLGNRGTPLELALYFQINDNNSEAKQLNETVAVLLDAGADALSLPGYPLARPIGSANASLVELFLNAGVNPNVSYPNFHSPLSSAALALVVALRDAEAGRPVETRIARLRRIIQLLLQAGANPNLPEGYSVKDFIQGCEGEGFTPEIKTEVLNEIYTGNQ